MRKISLKIPSGYMVINGRVGIQTQTQDQLISETAPNNWAYTPLSLRFHRFLHTIIFKFIGLFLASEHK